MAVDLLTVLNEEESGELHSKVWLGKGTGYVRAGAPWDDARVECAPSPIGISPMSIQITHVRLSPGYNDEAHIVRYKWVDSGDGEFGESDKPAMVDWIDNKNGEAFVGIGAQRVGVAVVRPEGYQPYLRTHADGTWTNNLLALPRF